ncbi:MAG TPA: (2Fe-2S)-binding protein [Anaeromyxobacteraceae bacterium]|nr:(2Fe-2S)-binding protein [Anaeromyxobacteraceae bacterium]
MIVCSCRAVSDHTLHDLAARGLPASEVFRVSGAGSDCGCCAEVVAGTIAAAVPCRVTPCADCPRAPARAA